LIAYAVRRLLISIPILLISTFVVFVMVSLSGDPLSDLRARQPPPPASVLKAQAHLLRLDQPLLLRYWHWITGVLHGDFGPSVQNVNISHEIWTRFGVTIRLVLLAVILSVVIAGVVGVVSAAKQYSAIDYVFTTLGFLFLAMPVFWFAILLKQLAININLNAGRDVFYTIGDKSIDLQGGFWTQVVDIGGHMVLPTLVLAMTSFASWSRYNRASMLEVLNSDYVRLARAKGLPRRRVLIRHALRTALAPMVTVMSLDFATLFSGAVVTETVFQWRGMGDFLLTAIRYRDVYSVVAWLLIAGTTVIIMNLIADMLYGVLDPRIRYA
jgi:peptide/nickel transport system permease protein